jgi:D-alanine-D-alanine ligase
MMGKEKILVLCGGISKEREVSLETGKEVAKVLKINKYKVAICEPDRHLIDKIKKFKPNIVFNALHGQFGEDGYIQAILESQNVKYTHSGVISSSIAMDKEISKRIYIKNKILTPKYFIFKFNINLINQKLIIQINKKLKFPVVVKPINEGSSVNVFICNKNNLVKNLKKLSLYKEVLIEQFISGREIQVAILGKKKLGLIELLPKRKFYDYKAKYNVKAKTKHIIPVDLSKKNKNIILNIAQKAHNLIGCKGVTRSDFKFYKNKFYLLETNTQPGMTRLSLVPEIAAYSGMSFIKLIEWILKDASKSR